MQGAYGGMQSIAVIHTQGTRRFWTSSAQPLVDTQIEASRIHHEPKLKAFGKNELGVFPSLDVSAFSD